LITNFGSKGEDYAAKRASHCDDAHQCSLAIEIEENQQGEPFVELAKIFVCTLRLRTEHSRKRRKDDSLYNGRSKRKDQGTATHELVLPIMELA